MIADFLDAAAPERLSADACVVGGGPAGITLALRLARYGFRTVLLESGGRAQEGDDQEAVHALSAGASTGQGGADPGYCRLRRLGGSTGHWQGWCGRLDAQDFAPRSWLDGSGWPVGGDEITQYYPEAESLCELEPLQPTPTAAWLAWERFWRFSPPTRFGTRYAKDLSETSQVTVLVHATMTSLDCDGASIRGVHFANLAGRSGHVQARVVVLATGGMENARLLLQPVAGHPRGIGNRYDQVGRYFMQHIELPVARLLAADPQGVAAQFDTFGRQRRHLVLSREASEARRLLRCAFSVSSERELSGAYLAARRIWGEVREGRWPEDLDTSVEAVFSDLGGLIEGMRGAQILSQRLNAYAEQAPDPASRVTLVDERDPFGLRRLRVDWRLSEQDFRSIRSATLAMAEWLGQHGIGRLQIVDWLTCETPSWPEHIWGGCHHMGTTRMSTDARSGVVDADQRVHGMENLFVAGSSVFPTGGYVPPTLTIVALSLRLADHLKGVLS